MALPEGIVSDFEAKTKWPLGTYLNDYVSFISTRRADILDYYSGKVDSPNQSSFTLLQDLIERSNQLRDVFENNRDRLRSGAYWELAELTTDIHGALETIDNSSKWLRSAITKNNFSPSAEITHTLRQLQNLEQVAGEVLDSINRDNDWVQIALRNDLREESYTSAGGNELSVGSSSSPATIRLNSVVDNISGKRVYGIDLQQKLEFADNDLVALSYDDTLFQSVNILAKLFQGATPEFPTEGIQKDIIGSNRISLPYPILFRQFYNTFQNDDTLKAFAIKTIELEQDAIKISFDVETRLGEVKEIETQV